MTEHDLSEFEQYELQRGIRRCRVDRALGVLMTDEAALRANEHGKLIAALDAEDRVSNAAIHRWCKARELDTTIASVIAHRKGNCSCAKLRAAA